MNKEDILNLKGTGGGQGNPNPTTSTANNTSTTPIITSNSNTIQPLYVDLTNNTTLSNNYTNFITNLINDFETFIGYYNTNNSSPAGAYGSISTILTTIIQGQLENGTYAYPSSTLLTLWNNNIQQLAMNLASDFGLYFLNFANAYYMALNGASQTTNLVSGGNFGTVSSSAGSEYTANTSLNSNTNTTLASANNNFTTTNSNQNTQEGGFSYQGNPASNTGYANGVNINNSAMVGDTTPIKDSSGTFHGNSTNQMEGLQIAKFLQENFKTFQNKLRDVLYDCFYEYLLPVNNLDNDIWGYNG